jgi:hypothetical protein
LTGKENCRGSISVFFALLLATLLAIIGTSLESARHMVISYLTAQAGESALESAFAGYYNPLWEQYHLFFLADGPGLVPMMEDSLSYYEEPGRGGSVRGVNLYTFRTEKVTPQEVVTAVDDSGAAFLRAVAADMKDHGMEESAGLFLGQVELTREAETVSGYIGSLSEYERAVSDIEDHYRMIESQGQRLRETYEGLAEALDAGTLTEETGRSLLSKAKSSTVEALWQTEECYRKILIKSGELRGSLEKEEDRLLEQKEQVSQTSYGQMEEALENLEEYTREEGSRRTAAEEAREILAECAGDLNQVTAWEKGAASEELKEIIKKDAKALNTFEEKSGGNKQKSELLEMVRSWKENGILGLVLEDAKTVSDRRLLDEERPSKSVGESAGEGESVSAVEKGTAALYAASHFGRFGQERENTVLAYETEYILGGMKSDEGNLRLTAEKLLALRSGMNFLYLLTDKEKQAEAELLAAALVGFTGIYPLVKFMKGVLLGAWAFAEAVTDVRLLYKGGQVPLVKTREDWRLSLEGAADAASYEVEAKEEEGVWNYRGYLCVLLSMESTKDLCYRMMDLIEANLRQQDSGFFMENCISYASVEFRFQAEPSFFQLALPGNSGYVFNKTAAYGYYEQQTEK